MAYLSLRGVADMVKTIEIFDRALFVQFASPGSTSLLILTLVSVPPSRSAFRADSYFGVRSTLKVSFPC